MVGIPQGVHGGTMVGIPGGGVYTAVLTPRVYQGGYITCSSLSGPWVYGGLSLFLPPRTIGLGRFEPVLASQDRCIRGV